MPCLPPNGSGQTCIGLAMVIRVPRARLHLYQPELMGRLDPAVAGSLAVAVRASRALTGTEKRAVLAGLASIRD